jgi:hypothetical protein
MTKRITATQKKIADAHLAAKVSGEFDNPVVVGREQLVEQLKAGKTFKAFLDEVETRFCSVGSLVLASPQLLGHQSKAYKANVYRGFKIGLTHINII